MKLVSKQDVSVNYIHKEDAGFFESRFVQRDPSYYIIYVSSHTGCNQSCRFCHLTASGQTSMIPATVEDICDQVTRVLDDLDTIKVEKIHVNFMARGEPLLNPHLPKMYRALDSLIINRSNASTYDIRYNVSSILPQGFELSGDALAEALCHKNAMLYYSLYSFDESFRKRWLPKAHNPVRALEAIQRYQWLTGKEIVIHGAFIQNENDRASDIEALRSCVKKFGIKAKFNLVRYNPFKDNHGVETPEWKLSNIIETIGSAWASKESRIVPRVGSDVYASCGMFHIPEE